MDREINITVGLLVSLLLSQLFFISNRTRIRKRGDHSTVTKAATLIKALNTESRLAKTEQDNKKIDPGLFTKFQENLKQTQQPDRVKPVVKKDEGVVVSISSQGKKAVSPDPKTKPSSAKHVGKIPTEPIGDLFDDIEEPEATASSGRVDPKPISRQPRPLLANEILTGDDLKPGRGEPREEAEVVLTMAKNEFEKHNYKETLSIIGQFLRKGEPQIADSDLAKELVRLKGDCEFAMEKYDFASKTWQELFKRFVPKSDSSFLPILEELIQKYLDKGQQKHAVHFLFTALNEYRQQQNFVSMDTIYQEIEAAYRQMEDWPRLIQTLQNHLSIRKTLKDHTGQLDLLDHLGKLLYDQGDAASSKKCYERRLVIENEMAKE